MDVMHWAPRLVDQYRDRHGFLALYACTLSNSLITMATDNGLILQQKLRMHCLKTQVTLVFPQLSWKMKWLTLICP